MHNVLLRVQTGVVGDGRLAGGVQTLTALHSAGVVAARGRQVQSGGARSARARQCGCGGCVRGRLLEDVSSEWSG